jgi:hypothetical protein
MPCDTCKYVKKSPELCSFDPDGDKRRKGALRRDVFNLRNYSGMLLKIMRSILYTHDPSMLKLIEHDFIDKLMARDQSEEEKILTTYNDRLDFEVSSGNAFFQHLEDKVIRLGRTSHLTPSNKVIHNINQPTWDVPAVELSRTHQILDLYFTWVHPCHTLFNKDIIYTLVNGSPHIQKLGGYTTELLVKAVLSVGCKYSEATSNLGDQYFEEAQTIYQENPKPTLSTIQALGVMSLRQIMEGNIDSARDLQSLMMSHIAALQLHHRRPVLNSSDKSELALKHVSEVTFWGCYNLHITLGVILGHPNTLPKSLITIDLPKANEIYENEPWRSDSRIAGFPITALVALTRLSYIVDDISRVWYNPTDEEKRIMPAKVEQLYLQLNNWLQTLPQQLQAVQHAYGQILPHVLNLQ